MWKKLTAALLVTCMLFGAPAPVSLASNTNLDISKVETIDTEDTEAVTEVLDATTQVVPEENTDAAEKIVTDQSITSTDVENTESSANDSENDTSVTVLDEEVTPVSDTTETNTPGEDSTAKDGQNVPEEQVPDSNANEPVVVNENEPVVDDVTEIETTVESSFAKLTVGEQYAYIMGLESDEEINAVLAELSEEELSALEEYAVSQQPENTETPETVVFTDAGPFMDPVTVGAARRRMVKNAASAVDNEGLETSKTTVANDDGSYTITIESYATGTVSTITQSVPVDIVLVLDQSGSMAYDFNGKSTSTNSARRQYAMKQAVNGFIDAVNEKYDDKNADHRMAIVTFGSDASILMGWKDVNKDGMDELKGSINGLPDIPNGATNVAAGMKQAGTLMDSGYGYTGKNPQRQKVVIVFTDGVPTTSSDFSTDVATNAIKYAKSLKDDDVTVYSIGIFNGANPKELYGASGFDTTSDGTVGSKWIKDTWGLFPGSDFPEADRPAGNRFLNYLSSNFPTATSVGLKRSTSGLGVLHYNITYEITENFNGSDSGYYLTAKDSDSLNTIFQEISQNIQTPSITLGSEAMLKDIVAPSFTVPANAEITVQTAVKTANGWGSSENDSAIKVTVEDDTISVTGFDYSENFVSETAKSDGTYGKKLIVSFKVWPKDGFLGGNNVPTNGSDSGIYDGNGNPVENFEQPEVNVPIGNISVTAQEKNVYLLADVSADDLKDNATVTVGEVELNIMKDNFDLEDWQKEYVDIDVKIKDQDEKEVTDFNKLSNDTTYLISVTVSPKADGNNASGDKTVKVIRNGSANINVYKPEVTFKDTAVYYGDTAPEDYDKNYVSTVWKHGETEAKDAEMTGTAPELIFDYTPRDRSAFADGKIAAKEDILVDVTTKIGNIDVTDYTTYLHEDCDSSCGFDKNEKYEFLLHVKTCDLTIVKEGGESGENFVFNIEKDGEAYTTVVVPAGGSVTISELPVGIYTVSEDESWAWRYQASYKNGTEAELNSGIPNGTITCENKKDNDKWLTWTGTVKNVYKSVEGGND